MMAIYIEVFAVTVLILKSKIANYHNCLYGFNQLIKHNTTTYTKIAQLIQQQNE